MSTTMYAFLSPPGTEPANDILSAWHTERLVEDQATYLGAAATGW